jgi:hypothetical protein
MATMDGLGRVFNYIAAADGVYINLRDGTACSFLCYLTGAAGDTWTITEAKTSAGGSAQVLACATRWWTCTGDGTDKWVARTQAAASTIVTAAAATQNAMCVTVGSDQLDDGFSFVKITSTGAGLVTALLHDLDVQRRPSNLAALGS